MPSLPFVPGVAKIVVKQTLGAVNVYNVMHADGGAGTGWTTSELTALATAVRGVWQTNFAPLMTSGLTINEVVATDLASDTGPEATVTSTTTGGLINPALSSNAACCITWKINRRYRGGHPRTYIAGGTSGQTSNTNTWLTSHVTNVTTAATALRNAINGVTTSAGNARFACVHYRRSGVLLATPLVSDITAGVVDTRIDSQRRRLGRDR